MALSKYTILVADCIPTDMLLLNILLKQAHCSLLTATDGIDALQQARHTHPDLVLLDIHMPRLNGFEVAEALNSKEETRHIPILYIVDMGDYPVFTLQGKLLSPQEYIEKPFNIHQLVKRILQRLAVTNTP